MKKKPRRFGVAQAMSNLLGGSGFKNAEQLSKEMRKDIKKAILALKNFECPHGHKFSASCRICGRR